MSLFSIIRDQIDLAELAAGFTELKRVGRVLKGLCPLPSHNESSPSFCIYPDRRWHCYGCSRHGDVVDLWAEVKGIQPGILAALDLAREYSVILPRRDSQAEHKALLQRQREDNYMRKAETCHQRLTKFLQITQYLEHRGFGAELQQRFLLGASEDGLAVVIPYWHRGRVVGLIRRLLQGEPKYLYPRSEGFACGYKPLFIAGPSHGDKHLVEGIFDALAIASLDLCGMAVGGSRLSQRQYAELDSLHGIIYILPDRDKGGEKAGIEWTRNLYPRACLSPAMYGLKADGADCKDIADLFQVSASSAKQVLDDLKSQAIDALDFALAQKPDRSARSRYNYAKEHVLPLLLRLEDEGERIAAIDDVVSALKLRTGEIKSLVKAATSLSSHLPTQETSRGLDLVDPPLWPCPVGGVELLDDIVTLFRRFIAAPTSVLFIAALWGLYTHVIDAFEISPLLAITSPEKRCGKSTLLIMIGILVPRPLPASNITASALFRSIEKYKPTLLIDEADSFMNGDEQMRGILNCGHRRGMAYVVRSIGDDHEPKIFSTWAAKAIALIGSLPSTLEDRAIEIRMQRMLKGEAVQELRMDRLGEFEALRSRAARWAADNFDILKIADPEVPEEITNSRARDNWRVLLAIADAVGGNWPERARAVAKGIASEEILSESAPILMLKDLRNIFNEHGDNLTSDKIIHCLIEMESRPWAEWTQGRPISKVGLARLLLPFAIKPQKWRAGGLTLRGYCRDQFEETFARYLGDESPQSPQALISGTYGQIESPQNREPVATSADDKSLIKKGVATVATEILDYD